MNMVGPAKSYRLLLAVLMQSAPILTAVKSPQNTLRLRLVSNPAIRR